MEQVPKSSDSIQLQDAVNYTSLVNEIRKMRGLTLEEKEEALDIFATIMEYQHSCESALPVVEEGPIDGDLKPLDDTSASNTVDQNGKKVLKVSGNGKNLEIRGYKASLPRGTTVIRYRLTTDGQPEPVPGFGSKSVKMGHTKEKIIEKLRFYLGAEAEKAISDFSNYDSTFYQQG